MDAPPTLTIHPDGPYEIDRPNGIEVLYARSRTDHDVGDLPLTDHRALICRCGLSTVAPACDGACRRTTFTASRARHAPETASEPGVCRLAFVDHGPLMVAGLSVVHEDGTVTDLTDREAPLCRCGRSNDKPWCDHTHRKPI